ncbi:MAG TPA: hypothetical protein VM286_04445 [Candidatus Thermoplasmatota archaeon]|nr:hypothetical protein [Candidatus Thermoplasmatota archaeon]
MTRRVLRRDDGAVSTTLGAILMFGLLVLTLVTVQIKFVPVWDRERESTLMLTVGGQFAAIKSDIDRQADNRSTVPVTDPLSLAPSGGFSFFTRAVRPADLAFAPAGSGNGFGFYSSSLHVLSRNGQPPPTAESDWKAIATNTEANIVSIQNLRLRIADPASYTTGQSVLLTISDAANAYAGQMKVNNIDHGPTYTFEVLVYSAASAATPINIVQLNFDKGSPPAYQYIDLLDRSFQFNQVLSAAATPFRLDLTRNGMVADYARTYTAQSSGGTTTVGNIGTPVTPAANVAVTSLGGGTLMLTSHNQQYPQQTYVLEYGAVILVQPDGAVMASAPSFQVAQVAGQVKLDWVVPGLTGLSGAVTGPPSAQVALAPIGSRIDLQATAPCAKFTLGTSYGLVWSSFWNTVMASALPANAPGTPPFAPPVNCDPPAGCVPPPGVSVPTGPVQFYTCYTTTSATLLVYGLNTATTPVVDDVFLNLRGGAILTTPKSSATG